MTEDRSTYIGSSDARAVMAGDFLRVFKEKKGLAPAFEQTFSMQLGLLVEDFHLDWTIDAINREEGGGFKFSKFAKGGSQHFSRMTASDYDFKPVLGSHPDALGRDISGMVFPIEAKLTARFRNIEQAADFYMPQLQHHMICWGVDRLLFSVIIGTAEPVRAWIGSSPEWQARYLDQCNTLWHYLKADIPPPPLITNGDAIVPQSIANTVPINGMTRRDMAGNNRWKAIAAEFLETKPIVEKHEKAKKDLKEMMQPDESSIYDDTLELKRDARGAIRINIKKDAAA